LKYAGELLMMKRGISSLIEIPLLILVRLKTT
jgi:hypothetical protein